MTSRSVIEATIPLKCLPISMYHDNGGCWPLRTHSTETETETERATMQLSQEKTFLFTIRRCWRKNAKVELDIYDHVMVNGSDSSPSLHSWLFTSNVEQVVKRKKRDQAFTLARLAEHIGRIQNFSNSSSVVVQPFRCVAGESSWFPTSADEIFTTKSTTLIVIPNVQSFSGKECRLLRVRFQRDGSNLLAPPKVKVFRTDSSTAAFSTTGQVECRANVPYGAAAIQFAGKLCKVLDSSTEVVVGFECWVVAQGLEVDDRVPQNSPDRFRIWLHHISECSISSIVEKSLSSSVSRYSVLDEDTVSQLNVIKPWNICAGDFCSFNPTEREKQRSSILLEARSAVERHRRMEDGVEMNEAGTEYPDDEEEADVFSDQVTDHSLPLKSHRVTMKWIEHAQSELATLEEINSSLTRPFDEEMEHSVQVRNAVAEIWPLSVAIWHFGRDDHLTFRGHSKTTTDDSTAHRRFSHSFSQVTVCNNCYFVYTLLAKFRKQRELRKERELRELKTKDCDERAQGRDIERRIFSQRQLATRLSKCKSAPAAMTQADHAKLPSLHWQVSTRQNGVLPETTYSSLVHPRSIVEHMMKRESTRFDRAAVEQSGNSVDLEWNRITTKKPPIPRLKPIAPKKQPQSMIVNTENYDALRLLHPWQRELHQLRAIKSANIHNEEVQSLRRTDHDDDDAEDDDFDLLGWNPYSIS